MPVKERLGRLYFLYSVRLSLSMRSIEHVTTELAGHLWCEHRGEACTTQATPSSRLCIVTNYTKLRATWHYRARSDSWGSHCSCPQELLVAEKGGLEVRLSTSESTLQEHQQQLSELTQKHTAIQAELADSLEYQQQIETQLNELEMEAQAAKASYEAEQGQSEKLRAEASQTQAELSRAENELTHTNTALTQTSELNRELQVSMRPAVTIWQCYMLCFQHMQLLAVYNLQELQRHWVCMACL